MTGPAIVADTTSYLPPELTERHGVQLVSLYVGIDGRQERESEITDYDDFYERLRASGEAVTTSQPSVGDFISVYEPLLADGREIVSVHISAGISGTLESAKQAIERLTSDGKGGERIHTVDSRSAAGGTGMVLLGTMIAASGGADPEGVVRQAELARDAGGIWFSLDTLEYLRRGGRIGTAAAAIGRLKRVGSRNEPRGRRNSLRFLSHWSTPVVLTYEPERGRRESRLCLARSRGLRLLGLVAHRQRHPGHLIRLRLVERLPLEQSAGEGLELIPVLGEKVDHLALGLLHDPADLLVHQL